MIEHTAWTTHSSHDRPLGDLIRDGKLLWLYCRGCFRERDVELKCSSCGSRKFDSRTELCVLFDLGHRHVWRQRNGRRIDSWCDCTPFASAAATPVTSARNSSPLVTDWQSTGTVDRPTGQMPPCAKTPCFSSHVSVDDNGPHPFRQARASTIQRTRLMQRSLSGQSPRLRYIELSPLQAYCD
jgi:hypothetical protein